MHKLLILLFIVSLGYLAAAPVPVAPIAWQAPVNPGYVGQFEPNHLLVEYDALELDGLRGPEAVVVDREGVVYASTHEGWIVRGAADDPELRRWVKVDGRPLGLAFGRRGQLWVANAYLGLQKISLEGEVSNVLSQVDGSPILYADDLAIAPDGKIYFSDASTRFGAKSWGGTLPASLLDINEHSRSGRIIEFNPETQRARVVVDGFSFANGVALDPAGRFLLIAETGEYRVWKHWLLGPERGRSQVIIDQLPGFPDNVHRGLNGRFWVGLTSPRAPILDQLADWPWLRKVLQRLPEFVRPKIVPYGMVFAIDANGAVLHNLQAPEGEVYATTGAAETEEYLYVTSLTMPVLARYRKRLLSIK